MQGPPTLITSQFGKLVAAEAENTRLVRKSGRDTLSRNERRRCVLLLLTFKVTLKTMRFQIDLNSRIPRLWKVVGGPLPARRFTGLVKKSLLRLLLLIIVFLLRGGPSGVQVSILSLACSSCAITGGWCPCCRSTATKFAQPTLQLS